MSAQGFSCLALLCLVLNLPHPGRAWLKLNVECHPGCVQRGNCNKELQKCDCPPGWAGPTCEEPVLGACRSNLSMQNMVGHYGTKWPKSCQCLRQLRLFFSSKMSPDAIGSMPGLPSKVDYPTIKNWQDDAPCYTRTNLSSSEQFSDIPDFNETGVEWFKPLIVNGIRSFIKLDARPQRIRKENGDADYWPLKYCKNRCNDRGMCIGSLTSPTEPMCVCSVGYRGDSCELERPDMISLTDCGPNGRVVGGWCHCEPGRWGTDCTRTTAWGPDPNSPQEQADKAYSRTAVKIYRYDIPWEISHGPACGDDEMQTLDNLYGAADRFMYSLLRDPNVLTENPWEANLFYVETHLLWRSNVYLDSEHVEHVLQWVEKTYPIFFNRSSGKDHVVAIMCDYGSCQLEQGRALRVIKMSHWGPKENNNIKNSVPKDVYVKVYSSSCYDPARDIVLPALLREQEVQGPAAKKLYSVLSHPQHPPNDTGRKYLVFFGGSIRMHEEGYSGGARQAFAKYFLNDGVSKFPDELQFGGSHVEMSLKSHFCLVMAGTGFPNTRLTLAMQTGCIPVIIMDFIYQPFHDVLPYRSFSVRIPHKDIPNLLEILRAIPESERAHMRRAMAHYHNAFNWYEALDGQAYRYTIASLHRRLHNLWGYEYKKL